MAVLKEPPAPLKAPKAKPPAPPTVHLAKGRAGVADYVALPLPPEVPLPVFAIALKPTAVAFCCPKPVAPAWAPEPSAVVPAKLPAAALNPPPRCSRRLRRWRCRARHCQSRPRRPRAAGRCIAAGCHSAAPSCGSPPVALPPHTKARAAGGMSVSPAAIVTIAQPANSAARRLHKFEHMATPPFRPQASPPPRPPADARPARTSNERRENALACASQRLA